MMDSIADIKGHPKTEEWKIELKILKVDVHDGIVGMPVKVDFKFGS
jgi:hypothetical protein